MFYAVLVRNDLNFILDFCIQKILNVEVLAWYWPDIFAWTILSPVFDEPRSHVAIYMTHPLFDTVCLLQLI